MSKITASKLELGMLCASAFALPHSDVRVQGSDPERGKQEHAEDEVQIQKGNIPEELERRWPGYEWLAEVKVCYDLATDTGEIFGYGSDRGYQDRGPFVVFGTADIVGRGPGGEVVVVDRKGFNEQTPAARNPQVSILALALTRALGVRSADVAIWPRAAAMDVATLDAMDLDAFAVAARAALAEVARSQVVYQNGGQLKFNEGRHCTYCPAFAACPAKQALALTLKGEPPLKLDLANDNDATDAYVFASKVRMLLKRLDAAIYARAAERPIPLPDGRELGPVVKEGNEKLDGDVMWRVVAEKHGRDIADAAVIRSATKSRLKEALGLAGVASVAKAEREVLDAVREAGGASRKESTVIEPREVQRLLKVVG